LGPVRRGDNGGAGDLVLLLLLLLAFGVKDKDVNRGGQRDMVVYQGVVAVAVARWW
jgi:hypothetical protein